MGVGKNKWAELGLTPPSDAPTGGDEKAQRWAELGLTPPAKPKAPPKRADQLTDDLGGRLEEGNHGPGAAGMLGALNSASVAGVSNVLAMKDAVMGVDSAKASGSKTLKATEGFEALPFKERFRINKE